MSDKATAELMKELSELFNRYFAKYGIIDLRRPQPRQLKKGDWVEAEGGTIVLAISDKRYMNSTLNNNMFEGLAVSGAISQSWAVSAFTPIDTFTEEHLKQLDTEDLRFMLKSYRINHYFVVVEHPYNGTESTQHFRAYPNKSDAIRTAFEYEVWHRYGERMVK